MPLSSATIVTAATLGLAISAQTPSGLALHRAMPMNSIVMGRLHSAGVRTAAR